MNRLEKQIFRESDIAVRYSFSFFSFFFCSDANVFYIKTLNFSLIK